MKTNYEIMAVIPVKGNRSRLSNKNIFPFAGSNLLVHKIRQLKRAKQEFIYGSNFLKNNREARYCESWLEGAA